MNKPVSAMTRSSGAGSLTGVAEYPATGRAARTAPDGGNSDETSSYKNKLSSAIFATLSVLLACTAPVWATEPAIETYRKIGIAQVIDGDTLDINGTRIHLVGIDAPEREQTCQDAQGTRYMCGKDATQGLRHLIGSRPISCFIRKYNGLNFGLCPIDGFSIGWFMVGSGHALVIDGFAALSNELAWLYLEAESFAQSAGIGMWQGAFTAPWDWRQQQ